MGGVGVRDVGVSAPWASAAEFAEQADQRRPSAIITLTLHWRFYDNMIDCTVNKAALTDTAVWKFLSVSRRNVDGQTGELSVLVFASMLLHTSSSQQSPKITLNIKIFFYCRLKMKWLLIHKVCDLVSDSVIASWLWVWTKVWVLSQLIATQHFIHFSVFA